MCKIGDFSQIEQVSVRMLRHYDKLGLLTPGHIDQRTSYNFAGGKAVNGHRDWTVR